MRSTIGTYRIDRRLGEGGMGIVYAAFDQRLRRAVAVKTLAHGRHGCGGPRAAVA